MPDKNAKPICYGCGERTNRDHYCYGCKQFICSECEVEYSVAAATGHGHAADDHLTKAGDEVEWI